jgi:hypothetical protein
MVRAGARNEGTVRGRLPSDGVPRRYVLVLVLSLVSGGAVYFITLRTGERQQLAGLGFGPPAPARSRPPESASPSLPEDEADQPSGVPMTIADPPIAEGAPAATARAGTGYTYLRVATSGPSARERLQGFVGLIVLVSVSAALLALAAYQAGHLINETMQHFLKGG